jgi:phosphotriesterase-related protein
MGIDDITSEFISDVRNGIDETRVRAGMIGEIGLSGHIHPDEEKVLRAGARAAIRTGAPLSIHPPGRTPHSQKDRTYPSSRWGLEILDIIEEEGLPPERVVICHMDRTLYEDIEYQKALAERGAYVEYDLWGKQNYYNDYNDGYPSDPDRVDNVVELIESGYVSQLLFSHDIAYKMWRRNYGGFGYAHILENVVPMLEHASVSMEQIRTIIEHNPQRMLTFSDPVE